MRYEYQLTGATQWLPCDKNSYDNYKHLPTYRVRITGGITESTNVIHVELTEITKSKVFADFKIINAVQAFMDSMVSRGTQTDWLMLKRDIGIENSIPLNKIDSIEVKIDKLIIKTK